MTAFTSFDHLGENFGSLMKRYAEYSSHQQSPVPGALGGTELNTIREEKTPEPIHIVNIVIQHPAGYDTDQEMDKNQCAEFIKTKQVTSVVPPLNTHSLEINADMPCSKNRKDLNNRKYITR